jgi:hypothetical protein
MQILAALSSILPTTRPSTIEYRARTLNAAPAPDLPLYDNGVLQRKFEHYSCFKSGLIRPLPTPSCNRPTTHLEMCGIFPRVVGITEGHISRPWLDENHSMVSTTRPPAMPSACHGARALGLTIYKRINDSIERQLEG